MREVAFDQITTVLNRVKYGGLSVREGAEEIEQIISVPDLTDDKLSVYLHQISEAHNRGTLRTNQCGPWAGLPTGRAIQDLLSVNKGHVRHIRDAWYRLVANVEPYRPDTPDELTSDEIRSIPAPPAM